MCHMLQFLKWQQPNKPAVVISVINDNQRTQEKKSFTALLDWITFVALIRIDLYLTNNVWSEDCEVFDNFIQFMYPTF